MSSRELRACLAALLTLLVVVLHGRPSSAQEPLGIEVPMPTPPATGGTEQSVIARYWELGRTRPFLATTLELGIIYLRPKFAAGYGRPHWSWVGVEAYPSVGFGGLGYYTGLAAALPGFTLRGGTRYFYPHSRKLLEPQSHYTRTDIDLLAGPVGDYVAHELEATTAAALGPGSVFGVFTGIRTSLVPEAYYLYEDSLKVVMAPPYAWRARAGYLLAFGQQGAIRLGAAAEVIGLPGRDEFVLRAGLLASVLISARLEAQVSMIPVLMSPDSLGVSGSDFGQLGIRYRWATDSTPDPVRVRRAVEKRRATER